MRLGVAAWLSVCRSASDLAEPRVVPPDMIAGLEGTRTFCKSIIVMNEVCRGILRDNRAAHPGMRLPHRRGRIIV